MPLEVILGFSNKYYEDLIEINDTYLDRTPENYFAIAKLNYMISEPHPNLLEDRTKIYDVGIHYMVKQGKMT
ncbi:hypothetical protein [Gilliamella sp. ESL0250]|uniref:hypothetical protein n=1 Tax=Gilliamella sp. ESL0250 TaxID=2705036 RepID=UPI0015800407|nr:hypothetical protein [Gilliamella sp. ESL0250]NUF48459.1 hypothetical protein [Gilliamella sp. ESL0250]